MSDEDFSGNNMLWMNETLLPEDNSQTKPSSLVDFDKILAELGNETIAAVLGRKTTPELGRRLQALLLTSYDNINSVEACMC